jgi:hypothetical protein
VLSELAQVRVSVEWERPTWRAVPPVAPASLLAAGPELTGRVVSSRWPLGDPPEELLGPAGQRREAWAWLRTAEDLPAVRQAV